MEFKAARGGLPKDLWETVSAFANTNGGWLLLGVADDGDIVGVRDAEGQLKQLWDLMRSTQKISGPVCAAEDTSLVPLGGKHVIVVRVPAAPRKARPVYINGNPYTGTFVRRASADYRCTKPEVDRMMRDASEVAADGTVLNGWELDVLDSEAVARYRRRFQTQNPSSVLNGYDDKGFLSAIDAYGASRDSGARGVRVAGLLLLGKPEAIREWRGRHMIDFREVANDLDEHNRWLDRVVWEGNLLGAFESIYPRLVEGLAKPFRLDGAARVDASPAEVALREAFVNLLIHADYSETPSSLIIKSPQGFLFRNPGSSRVSELDLLNGDRSDPRNPTLVGMFRRIGLAEEAGSGIPSILSSWKSLGFRLPEIDSGTERYEFSLRLRHAHLVSDEDRDWLNGLGGPWSESEQVALVLAKQEGEIDNQMLRRRTGQHSADVTKVLVSLRDRQLLEMIGDRRTARYRLSPAVRPGGLRGTQLSLSDLSDLDDLPVTIDESPQDLDHLRPELERIAEPLRSRSHVRAKLRDEVIVELCTQLPLSIKELAELTRRSEPSLRAPIRELVREGRLRFLHPASPKHPAQRYMGIE